jgi:hypothetical protein
MQPYIYPYIGYFQLINLVDKFVIFDDVNYIVRGWVNRNRILINGEPQLFTVPLEKASRNKLINEINVSYDYPRWRSKFLKTLRYNYKRAPFFKNVYPLIENTLNMDLSKLVDILIQSLKSVMEYLDIETELINSSTKYENHSLNAEGRIIDICLQEKARTYVNLIGGRDLYQKGTFDTYNVQLNFIKCGNVSYIQNGKIFHPSLSIIDVLMFNSKKKIHAFLEEYSII